MTITTFASFDAYDPCAEFGADDMVFWLQPQSTAQVQRSENGPSRYLFLRLTASLSLSAFMTFGSISAAIAPAAAHTASSSDLTIRNEPTVAIEAPTLSLERDLDPERTGGPESEYGIGSQPTLNDAMLLAPSPNDSIDVVARSPIPLTAEEQLPAVTEPAPVELAAIAAVPSSVEAPPQDVLANIVIDHRPPPDLNELLVFDGTRVPRWLVETILNAADATGVDPVYLMALADKESSFIPGNKARTSSADGLFQFISSTWLEVVRNFGPKYGLAAEAAAISTENGQLTIADDGMRDHVLGLRRDAYLSALMAAEMMKRDRARIEQHLGRRITRSEFYLAHFFGVQSASRFMALLDGKPKQSAPRVFPAAARANRALFFTKQGRKTRQLTVAEVYDKLDEMIDQRLDRYEDVKTIAANFSL
jgi:hypothetical protein